MECQDFGKKLVDLSQARGFLCFKPPIDVAPITINVANTIPSARRRLLNHGNSKLARRLLLTMSDLGARGRIRVPDYYMTVFLPY